MFLTCVVAANCNYTERLYIDGNQKQWLPYSSVSSSMNKTRSLFTYIFQQFCSIATEPWTIGRVNWCDTSIVKTVLGCIWRHSYTSMQTHKLILSEQETHRPIAEMKRLHLELCAW